MDNKKKNDVSAETRALLPRACAATDRLFETLDRLMGVVRDCMFLQADIFISRRRGSHNESGVFQEHDRGTSLFRSKPRVKRRVKLDLTDEARADLAEQMDCKSEGAQAKMNELFEMMLGPAAPTEKDVAKLLQRAEEEDAQDMKRIREKADADQRTTEMADGQEEV